MRLSKHRLIAHRCGGHFAPENTLAGLHAAARLGFEWVEFDVMLAACGTPVLIHDETLDRTTSGSGRVCDTPYSILATLDAGIRHGSSFVGEPIPRLCDALALADRLGLRVNVEIKPAAGFEARTAQVVADQLARVRCAGEAPLVSSFSIEALMIARKHAPALPRALLFECIPDDWQDTLKAVAAEAVHCEAARLRSDHWAECQALGVPLRCYTVNDRAGAEALLAAGVKAVFTDVLLPDEGKDGQVR